MLVILRLSLGCHFLYEGAWKIKHSDEFSARPFLTQAKGPMAPLFYAMVPDLDGRERLEYGTIQEGGKTSGELYLAAWKNLEEKAVDYYQLSSQQAADAEKVYKKYADGLKGYLEDNQKDIAAHFTSLDRFEKQQAADQGGTDFLQKRIWDERQKLRGEVNGWLSALDGMGGQYQQDLWKILDEDQQAKGRLPMEAVGPEKLPVPLPLVGSRSELVDKAVTYGLTAIGACLIMGLFTRAAAVGGALFMLSVLLSQPPLPWIYPPPLPQEGHALLVDKNFIEMVALLLVATTAVGRWAGLDFFVHRCLVRPFCSRKNPDTKEETA